MQILAAGALAGATSNLALYPLELARSRLATTDTYKGIGDCMGQIVKNHGVRAAHIRTVSRAALAQPKCCPLSAKASC
jgi:hypothetical protein